MQHSMHSNANRGRTLGSIELGSVTNGQWAAPHNPPLCWALSPARVRNQYHFHLLFIPATEAASEQERNAIMICIKVAIINLMHV